jgi:hypothetical protein
MEPRVVMSGATSSAVMAERTVKNTAPRRVRSSITTAVRVLVERP